MHNIRCIIRAQNATLIKIGEKSVWEHNSHIVEGKSDHSSCESAVTVEQLRESHHSINTIVAYEIIIFTKDDFYDKHSSLYAVRMKWKHGKSQAVEYFFGPI